MTTNAALKDLISRDDVFAIIRRALDNICAGGSAQNAQTEEAYVRPYLDGIMDEVEELAAIKAQSVSPDMAAELREAHAIIFESRSFLAGGPRVSISRAKWYRVAQIIEAALAARPQVSAQGNANTPQKADAGGQP